MTFHDELDERLPSSQIPPTPASPLLPRKPRPVGRISVVESVYYQESGQQPTVAQTKFSRQCKDGGQPYVRKLRVGEEWEAVDSGWVKEVGMLVVANDEGRFAMVQPSDEERKASKSRVVEVGFLITQPDPPVTEPRDMFFSPKPDEPPQPLVVLLALIPPGENIRLPYPVNLTSMVIRCQFDEAAYTLTVLPA